ncbi:LOW QUALITY PROTEIN: chymotrypsin-like elastase family member 1 [Ciconia maguari]
MTLQTSIPFKPLPARLRADKTTPATTVSPVAQQCNEGEILSPMVLKVWTITSKKFVHISGGTLIHKHWVLTANSFRDEMEDVSDWHIILEKHNLSHNESTQRVHHVKQIYQHEWFHENHSNHLDYDIALVKPMEDITANHFVLYACLPKSGCSLYPGQSCWVTGWGDKTGI